MSTLRCGLLCAALAGCSFTGAGSGGNGNGGTTDAGVDAEPDAMTVEVPEVRITSIFVPAEIKVGTYGHEVVVVVSNELETEITDVRATLRFLDSAGGRGADFAWRNHDVREGASPPSETIGAGETAVYKFRLDARPSAVGIGGVEEFVVESFVTFVAEGLADRGNAVGLDEPVTINTNLTNPTIVVDAATDDPLDGTTLRVAMAQAESQPGPDRIAFDPTVFPPDTNVAISLDFELGGLPPVNEDLVIDASGAAIDIEVDFAADPRWDGSGLYIFRLLAGTLVLRGLRLRNLAVNYPEDVMGNGNCGDPDTGDTLVGGALFATGGTLILDNNRVLDPGVNQERNCFGANVRIDGGIRHRILNNTFRSAVMDPIKIASAVVEIANNAFILSPALSDDSIFVDGTGGETLWVVGNLFVGQQQTAFYFQDGSEIQLINNTFVRCGTACVRRTNQDGSMFLRNNAYIGTVSDEYLVLNNAGVNIDLNFEHGSAAAPPCDNGCENATVGSDLTTGNADLENETGEARTDFFPASGSPLLDSATPLVDLNERRSRWFDGLAGDRGSYEVVESVDVLNGD